MLLKVHYSVLFIALVVTLSFTATARNVSDVMPMSHQKMQQDTCDKITNLELSICHGDTVRVGGENYFETGSYTDTLIAENGCDSIILLNLTVNPNHFLTIVDSICQGQSYNFNGSLLNSAGFYLANLTSSSGCDSIIQLSLSVNPGLQTIIDTTICEGRGIFIGGQYITSSSNFLNTYSTPDGCDSIVLYNIRIEKLEIPITISENSLTVLDSAFIYQWIDCDTGEDIPGPNQNIFTPTVSGNYSVNILFYNDCIGSSDCIEFIVTGTAENSISNAVSIYPNPTDGLIYIANDSGYPITSAVLSSISGKQIEKFTLSDNNNLYLSSLQKGMYLLKLEMSNTQVTKKVIIK